jgi:DNA polymerase-3 subunit epsilon
MDAAENPIRSDLPQDLVFVDLETTGGSPAYHRVIEVGVVRFRDGELIEEWSSLVDPGCPIPANIESFTGISNAMVRGAPQFADLAPTLEQKLRGALFVAHNARFDYSFLRREFSRAKIEFAATVLCTVKMSRQLYPQHIRHNLDAVMERHGISGYARHRALGDAQVLREFWIKVCRTISAPVLAEAIEKSLLRSPKLPPQLPAQLVDELPDGPGVYRYFGDQDVLLYVGKSNSLRRRVLTQLGEAQPGSRDFALAELTRRIDWFESPGELGTLLREAALLRANTPAYNRRHKSHAEAATLRLGENGSGRVAIIPIDELSPVELAAAYGLFRSPPDARKALADIAHAQSLCLKVLGLEESMGSCVAAQFGRCKGACTGEEPLPLHRIRTQMALARLKLKAWPFPGRIAVRERGHDFDELHVLDHWGYVGSARSEEELANLHPVPCSFDADVYKVLVRYFSNHARIDWRELTPT